MIRDDIRQQRLFQELDFKREFEREEERRERRQTKAAVIAQDENGDAIWQDGMVAVDIATSDGGGRIYVTLDVDKASWAGMSLTVNQDRGYY